MPRKKKLPPYVIEQNGDWYVRIFVKTERTYANGKRVYAQFKRKCAVPSEGHAIEALHDLRQEVRKIRVASDTSKTVDEFFEQFIAAKKGSVENRTFKDYANIYRRYIKKHPFAEREVSTLTPLVLQDLYHTLNLSPQMTRKVHTLLSMAFRQGIRWGMMAKNPCEGVILPRVAHTEIEIIEDASTFAAICLQKYLVLAFALETFMRPGEYLALTWKDVNLDKQTATVRRSVSFHGKGFEYKAPKTPRSRRTVHLSKVLCDRLREHRAEQLERLERLKIEKPLQSGTAWDRKGVNYKRRIARRTHRRAILKAFEEHNLVFPSAKGTPLSPTNLGRREMKRACTEAGLPAHSLYSLRHTGITLSLSAGVDIKTVSEKAGHMDIRLTLSTYVHTLPSGREDAADKISDVLYAKPGTSPPAPSLR